jgi:hypothetical protein
MTYETDELLKVPIIVTGTPRSGKTFTALILSHAQGLVYVEEPLVIWSLGVGNRNDDQRFADEATPDLIRQIRSLCAAEVKRAGGERYIDDLAYHGLRIDFVRAVMPDALFVYVIQDGYAAIPEMVFGWTFKEPFYNTILRRWRGIRSLAALRALPRQAWRWLVNHFASKVEGRRRAWGPQPPGLAEFAENHSDPAEVAAFQWKALVETALADLARLPTEQTMTIRFEDLVNDTQATVDRLARFCHIDDVEGLQRAAAELLVPNARHRSVELTPDEWRRIEHIIGPLRERLGYTSGIPITG